MKNISFLALIFAVFASCNPAQKEQLAAVSDAGSIAEIPTLAIDQFDLTAGQYVDQQVAVAGIVDHVCKHSGKKLKLVTDGGSVHVDSETRFDDALVGQQIALTGIVRELRVDESYCLQMEEDNIKKHRSGEMNEEQLGNQHKMIEHYRDSMKTAGVDHLSFYTLEYVALEKKADGE